MEYSQFFNPIESKSTAWLAWSAVYAVAGTIVVVLNSLTLYTFIKTSSFRNRKHVLVINLAIADLLYGAAGVPATMIFLFKPTIISYHVFQILHTFVKTTSLFTLGVIAVERMHAVVWPIRHKVMSNRVYKTALVIIWILSALATAAVQLKISIFASLLLPIAVAGIIITTVACYVCIWISIRLTQRREFAASTKRDKALAFTLLLVAGAFIVTWGIPIFLLSISRVCKHCYRPSAIILKCMLLVIALQSLVNPVIYCLRLPSFKVSLKARIQEMTCSSAIEPRRRIRPRQVTIETEMGSVSEIEVKE
ncbi:uncharacterized protein LOC144648878 [Oculina patagonica]